MKEDKVILGQNCIYSTDSAKTGINNNIIVCGGSGSGKTMSVAEPRLLETHNSSLVVVATKRRIVNKYKPLFEKRGYDVSDLNFADFSKSNIGYDPLKYVKSYQDISFLSNAIVLANTRKAKTTADPYWDEAAASLLSAEIAYIMMTKDNPNFTDVLEMHEGLEINDFGSIVDTSYDRQFKYIEEKDPKCFAVSCWNTFSKLPIKTAACVLSSLNTALDKIFTPDLRKIIAMENTIDFKSIAERKTVLFVTTSPVNTALNTFINIFYSQAFKELFEFAENQYNGMLPIPVHILCDDFATGGRILNFAEYISIFREKQISVSLLIQSQSQLESMYGYDDAVTIINNCDTYLYMGGMDIKTAKDISLRCNTPIDEILSMPVSQVVLMRRGQQPIITNRYNILENTLYQKITREYEAEIANNKNNNSDKNRS